MTILTTLLIIGAWFCVGWNCKGVYDIRKSNRKRQR